MPETFEVFTGEMYLQKEGITEWREVLCGIKIKTGLISRLQRAILNHGYALSEPDNTMGQGTINALVKYQKENGLPIGVLDLETLKSLGVSY